MSTVPYTFATASGNIPLSQLDTNFSNVKAFATTAGTVTIGAQPNITSVGTLTSLTVSGNLSAGNISGTFSGSISNAVYATSAGSATTATTAGTVTTAAQPNITSVGTLISLVSSGNITSSANISGSYILGNGSQLTGITANYNNSNVTTLLGSFGSNTISTTGDVTAGNFVGALNGSGANVTAISATNISAGTLAQARLANSTLTLGNTTLTLGATTTTVTGLTSLSVTGNINAGNVIATNLSGPVFMANVSAGQGVPTSPSGISQLPLVYDNVIANVGGDYSVGNSSTGSIFTASVPGFYQVSSAIGVTPSNWANVASYSSTGVVGIYVNDNPVASGPLIDFAGIVIGNIILQVTTSSSISTLVELNAGDTLKCKLAYLTTAPSNFWNTSTNLVQGYFQAAWIRS
jgi:hypothetical protein